jgi:hypothetical protein
MNDNTAALLALSLNTALTALTKVAEYQAVVAKAKAEGRDVSDDELAAARGGAVSATDQLAQMP